MQDANAAKGSLEPTRFGGLRRTRVVQKRGTPSDFQEETGAVATAKAGTWAKLGHYLVEHFRNTEEVGGSNPSPRTFVLKLNEKLGLPGCEYLVRWRFETPWGSVRLHHWLGPDDDRAFHDHPWDFVTFVLKGGYTDVSPEGEQKLQAFTWQYRSALHQHTVYPFEGGCWTLVFTGPKIRPWGFWVAGKFRKANKYFLSHGHHPCN